MARIHPEQRIVCETCGVISAQTFPGIDAGLDALDQHKAAGSGIHIAAIVDAIVEGPELTDEQLVQVLGEVWGNTNSVQYHVANIQLT